MARDHRAGSGAGRNGDPPASAAVPANPVDPADPVDEEILQLHDSKAVRILLISAGFLCIALGVIGVVLPIMPTVPFLLLAAACFARASPKFYRMLVRSKTFGPPIIEWRRYGSIPWRTKLYAMGLFIVSFTTSIVVFVRPLELQLLLGVIGAGILLYMARIPSRDRPSRP